MGGGSQAMGDSELRRATVWKGKRPSRRSAGWQGGAHDGMGNGARMKNPPGAMDGSWWACALGAGGMMGCVMLLR